MERRKVGILGATGMVGQRFIQLLEKHPWFEITWLAASDRSAGKKYSDACNWKLDTPLPTQIGEMIVQPNTVPTVSQVASGEVPRIIFSSVDSPIAKELEPAYAAAGCAVISNSSAFRMQSDVPLVIPEVNSDHFGLLETQESRKSTGGFLVTNPNCCAIGLVLALAPLQEKFGIESLFVSTLQAVSGAGYPGVASLDILGNVIPYIKNEEEKLQEEVAKLLGTFKGDQDTGVASIDFLDAKVSAHCNRVAVVDGHTECVSIKFKTSATYEEIVSAWREFQPLRAHHLPSAPLFPLEFDESENRPQPRLDLNRGNGMTTTLGRLRPCTLLDWKFVLLSHNTVRGAAGAAILNAEILAVMGKLNSVRPKQEVLVTA